MHRLLAPVVLLLAAPWMFRVGCDCDGGGGPWDAGLDAGPALPKVSALSDDFDDNARADVWGTYAAPPASTVSEVNQRLEISLDGGAAYAGYRTVAFYDATDAGTWVELVAVGPQDNRHEMILSWVGRALDQFAYVEVNAGAVFGGFNDGAGGGVFTPADAGFAVVRFLRLREQGGVLTWEYSLDGGTYHPILVRPDPFDLSMVQVDLGAGYNSAVGTPALDAFDNLNR